MHDVPVFDRFARPYEWVMPAADAGVLRAGLAHAERDVERGLDLAGGTGRAARSLPGVDWTVVDAARGMLAVASSHDLPTLQADARRLPVRDAAVDAVLVVDALHHLPDVETVLAEARRVLRPGGVLVVREFDPGTLRGRALVAAERLVGFDSRFFAPDDLAALASDADFDPAVPDRGFGYTLAATVPGGGEAADGVGR